MTILEVICKTIAIQNKSQWPCSMRPIPQLRLVGVRTSYIYFSNISWTLSSGPHYKSLFGAPPWLHPITNPLSHTSQGQSCHLHRQFHSFEICILFIWGRHVCVCRCLTVLLQTSSMKILKLDILALFPIVGARHSSFTSKYDISYIILL